MMKTGTTFKSLATAILFWTSFSMAAERAPAPDLPATVISFGFLVSHFPDFTRSVASEGTDQTESELVGRMRRLYLALESLDSDVPLRLSFPHVPAVVQSEQKGQVVTVSRSERSYVFVSTPLPPERESILVVLSSTSPERTTAFVLGELYETELVYDSFNRGTVVNDDQTVLGTVTEIAVEGNGQFLLKEEMEPGSRGELVGRRGRVFRLDIVNRTVSLESQ